MNGNKLNKSQSGQALILMLLVISVVLTVVMSSTSRSVTEIRTTTYEEDALRAFSAAEAGIEDKLLNPAVGTIPVTYPNPGDTSVYYSGSVQTPIVPDRQYLYPSPLSSGETATFWIVSQDSNGQLKCGSGFPCWYGSQIRVCYGNNGASPAPAVEVSIYYDETGRSTQSPNNYDSVKVFRGFYDRNSTRRSINYATDPGANPCNDFAGGVDLAQRATIATTDVCATCNTSGKILLVKVRMLYAVDQPVGIWSQGGAAEFPSQGILISSTGVAGETVRKVEVTRGNHEQMNPFDLAVFSKQDLIKSP